MIIWKRFGLLTFNRTGGVSCFICLLSPEIKIGPFESYVQKNSEFLGKCVQIIWFDIPGSHHIEVLVFGIFGSVVH